MSFVLFLMKKVVINLYQNLQNDIDLEVYNGIYERMTARIPSRLVQLVKKDSGRKVYIPPAYCLQVADQEQKNRISIQD